MYSVYLLYSSNRGCSAGCVYSVIPLVTVIEFECYWWHGVFESHRDWDLIPYLGIQYALGAPLSTLHLTGKIGQAPAAPDLPCQPGMPRLCRVNAWLPG